MPQLTIDLSDDAYKHLVERAKRRQSTPESFAESIVAYSLVFGWEDQLDIIRKIREQVVSVQGHVWLLLPEQLSERPLGADQREEIHQTVYRSAKDADKLLEQIAPGTMDFIGGPPWPIPPQNFPSAFYWRLLTTISLRSFLDYVWVMMRESRFLKPEHIMELHLEPGLPEEIRTNEDMLKNTLCNLLGNAIRFSPEGGKIQLTVRREGDNQIGFVIQDEGIGMPPEFLPRFGEAFARVDTTQKFVGIGAHIARIFAQRYRGKLWAESDGLGKGSTVTLVIPAICPEFTWHDSDYQDALDALKQSKLLISTWLAEAEWLTAEHDQFNADARAGLVAMAKTEQERILAFLEELSKKDHD